MVVNTKKMTGTPVITKSGMTLGKVASFDIERESGRLHAIRVKTRGLVPGLLDQELTVAWAQILEVAQERVVVTDAIIPAGGSKIAARVPSPAPHPGMSTSAKS
jgi:sporulation protein YlmC with PRC-barrel domain